MTEQCSVMIMFCDMLTASQFIPTALIGGRPQPKQRRQGSEQDYASMLLIHLLIFSTNILPFSPVGTQRGLHSSHSWDPNNHLLR